MALDRSLMVGLVIFTAACGSSTAPHGTPKPTPGLSFLAGNGQTDSVTSSLNQALVVQVSSAGAPVPGAVVQFLAVPAADSAQPNVQDWVDPVQLNTNIPTSFAAETTDASGQVTVGITLGERAGKAPLIVKVPQLGYVDTAVFTVAAGGAASLKSGPADTTTYVNATVTLHSSVVDRFGNPRSDPVTYTVLAGPAHITGAQVTTTGLGIVSILGKASIAVDTSYIEVVPPGLMAASLDAGGIATFNLDGSGYKVITTAYAGTVVWSPSGTSLAFDQTSGGGTYGGSSFIDATTTGGTTSVLDNSGGAIDAWPAYSRDGTWIYYIKITNSADLWRVHADGTGDAAVTVTAGNPFQFPSPSPDGTQLVYVIPGAANVEILTLSTGVATPLGSVLANSTAWSPNSNLIAYNANGVISVIHSDGTGNTTLTAGVYQQQLGWSPDGNWIAARNLGTGKIDLISVVTPGLILPLGFSGTMGSPTWH